MRSGNDLRKNSFYYGIGNVNDTIQNARDGDNVILADIFLDQIIDAKIIANSVPINFIDSGSLKIDDTANVTYQLTDGSKYSANHEQLE